MVVSVSSTKRSAQAELKTREQEWLEKQLCNRLNTPCNIDLWPLEDSVGHYHTHQGAPWWRLFITSTHKYTVVPPLELPDNHIQSCHGCEIMLISLTEYKVKLRFGH